MKFKLGDSVVVKQGIKEPDFEEIEIGGWQGRIIEIDANQNENDILVTIEWDALTLDQIPSNYISQSEKDGYEWKNIALWASEIEKTKARDQKENVKETQSRLSEKHYWLSLGDQGARISKVLGEVDIKDIMECLQKWVEHLDKKLKFPIPAVVSCYDEGKFIKDGDKVIIKALPHLVDTYGIIASIKKERKKYEFPLCDLEVVNKKDINYQLIEDYKTWFANL